MSQEKTTLERISMSASKHVSNAKGTNQRNGGRQAKCVLRMMRNTVGVNRNDVESYNKVTNAQGVRARAEKELCGNLGRKEALTQLGTK